MNVESLVALVCRLERIIQQVEQDNAALREQLMARDETAE